MEDLYSLIISFSDDVDKIAWKHVCKKTSYVESTAKDRVCTEIAKANNDNLLSWARSSGYIWSSEITSPHILDRWLREEMSPLSVTIGERIELIEWSAGL